MKVYALSQTCAGLDGVICQINLKRHVTNQHLFVASAKVLTGEPAQLKRLCC